MAQRKPAKTPSPGEEDVARVLVDIGIIDQLVSAELLRRIGPHLNLAEFKLLNHFVRREARAGGAVSEAPTRLARVFQVTKPSMTATLAKLQAKGLIDVVAAEDDRRGKVVTLTDAGRAAQARGFQAMAPLAQSWLDGFGAERFAALRPMLEELRTFLDAQRNARDGL